MVHLRVSQINGCSFCVDAGLKSLRKLGGTDERIGLVAAWRETPYYTEAERAALALAECATRLADRADAVESPTFGDRADDQVSDASPTSALPLMWRVGKGGLSRRSEPCKEVHSSLIPASSRGEEPSAPPR